MYIYWFKEIPSTQEFLYALTKNDDSLPILVLTLKQTKGIGSRGNKWQSPQEGIYFSFALHTSQLPNDLPIQSSSIYFGWLFLQKLRECNKHVWLKWPNDLYIQDTKAKIGKIGGIMTQATKQCLICGMGINVFDSNYASLYQEQHEENTLKVLYEILSFLGLHVKLDEILQQEYVKIKLTQSSYNTDVFTYISWQHVFTQYQQEFYKSHSFTTHITCNNVLQEIKLSDCLLCEDGSLMKDNKKFYSLR